MSVIKAKRSEAKTEFYINLQKMESEIIHFLLKDFNIKKSNRDVKLFAYKAKLNEEESKYLDELLKIHKEINIETSYPLWLLEYFREIILNDLNYVKSHVIEAYTIFPASEYEFNLKKGHIWSAIAGCFKLLSDVKLSIEQFHPLSKEKYMPTVKLIDDEISLLRTWKKTVNSQHNHIVKGMAKAEDKKKNKEKKRTFKTTTDTTDHSSMIVPIHFVPIELTMNVSFDSFVEKETITPIRFVPKPA